jgi:hypothetical protein
MESGKILKFDLAEIHKTKIRMIDFEGSFISHGLENINLRVSSFIRRGKERVKNEQGVVRF